MLFRRGGRVAGVKNLVRYLCSNPKVVPTKLFSQSHCQIYNNRRGPFSVGDSWNHFNKNISLVPYRGFCTHEPQESEGAFPPELLKSQTVSVPDRVIGGCADLIARVTNFQNEDKGLIVLAGDVFDVPIRKDIIHRVVRSLLHWGHLKLKWMG